MSDVKIPADEVGMGKFRRWRQGSTSNHHKCRRHEPPDFGGDATITLHFKIFMTVQSGALRGLLASVPR